MKRKIFSLLVFLGLFSGVTFSQVQNALEFDGVNDNVFANSANLTSYVNNFTMELWVYPTTTVTIQPQQNCLNCITGTTGYGQRYAIAPYYGGTAGNAGVGLSVGTNGILVYEHAASYMPALLVYNATLPAGWNHIAVVYIAKQPRLYLNGNLVATGLTSLKTNVYPSIQFGGYTYGYFPGRIDEFRVWNVSRSQDQIRADIHRELLNPASEINLKAYYKLNETSGTLVPDLSGNGNNGTLTNMDPSTDWVASTAPIPYFSIADGNWNVNSTWAAGQRAPVNAWSRVKVKNAVTLTANFTTEELTIDPLASLTVNTNVFFTVNGTIANNSGTAGLVVKYGGSLLNSTPGVNGTLETYISPNVWHFVSAPVSNAVSGLYTADYLQQHQESTNLYYDIVPTNVPLNVMQGYALWGVTGVWYNIPGTFNAGAQSLGLTRFNQGWNLAGNPYPSSIDWDAATGWTKTNVNNAIYFENNGIWASYIAGVGTNNGSRFIAPGQGFFVNCNTHPGTLGMNDNVRVHNLSIFFKDDVSDMVRLKITGTGGSDETVVRLLEMSTPGFDGMYDAYKIAANGFIPEIYSLAGAEELSINALPACETVPLGFRTAVSGTFTIAAPEIKDLTPVILEDKVTGTYTDLRQFSYTFEGQQGDEERFVLHLKSQNPGSTGREPLQAYSSGNQVYFNLDENQRTNVEVFDLLGQEMMRTQLGGYNNSLRITKPGVYIVRATSGNKVVSTKVNIQ